MFTAPTSRTPAATFLLAGILGIPITLLTEELFFRGWLWAALGRAGASTSAAVWTTSIVFALWHLSAAVLPTGFNPPPAEVPVFLINAAAMGAI